MLAGAAGGRPAEAAPAFTGDVFVAIAALVLGVCLVLACVVLPGDARRDAPHLRARVAQTGPAAVGATALAGAVHAIAAERSPWGFPAAVAVVDVLAAGGGRPARSSGCTGCCAARTAARGRRRWGR